MFVTIDLIAKMISLINGMDD